MPAPTLISDRLRLRPHRMSDMAQFEAFYASPRSEHTDAPANPTHLYYGFTSEVGTWDLRGFGGWAIEAQDGAYMGQIAIIHPPHFPEREIGWILFEGYEGHGYAAEAATLAIRWAWAQGWDTLVSYISPGNHRSIALATRLGATHDPHAALPSGDTAQDTHVYRHSPPAAEPRA